MILFPAIDLKDGQCVRLVRGVLTQATVFNTDPADQARAFEAAGFSWLHLVDLNGAFEGHPVNGAAVRAVRAAISLPIQLGGGIRDLETVGFWLDAGIERVILGTVALSAPEIVYAACRRFPGQIVVALDARDGKVATDGWAHTSQTLAVDLGRRFEDAGVAALIYTDIDRDGTLGGLNVEATAELAGHLTIPIIASGGVASLDDLRRLKQAAATTRGRIEGVISGRALYDGQIPVGAALALLEETAAGTGTAC